MSSVDDRIVNMQFNNKQFTQGAAESQRSLEGLDKTIAGVGKNGSLDGMASSVDKVAGHFSALKVAGVTAIATIANKVTNFGINMAKSLTIDPITEGFQNYETKINAVQTILANTADQGTKLKDVTKNLNELNKYANQTVYNFSEMAKNIGTFTAAGVDLKTSTASIKGIANLAALSGSTSQQASSAMYQLSQAIAAGQVHLQDWNSVVNAGIGGAAFQKNLITSALATGTLDKSQVHLGKTMADTTINGVAFRQSLTPPPGGTSWLTSGVLTKSLGTFTGDMSKAQLASQGFTQEQIKSIMAQAKMANNAATQIKTFSQLFQALKEEVGTAWASVFEALFGNINQAKAFLSPLHTMIENALTKPIYAIADALKSWRQAGGFEDLINIFKNLGTIVGNLLFPFKELFAGILPSSQNAGKGLEGFTKLLADLTGWIAKATSVTHEYAFVFEAVGAGIHTAIGMIGPLLGQFKQLQPVFDRGLASVQNFGAYLQNIWPDIVNGLLGGMDPGQLEAAVVAFAQNIIDWIKGTLGIHSPSTVMIEVGFNIVEGIVEGLIHGVSAIASGMGTIIKAIFNGISKLFAGFDAMDFASLFNAILTGGLIFAIKKSVDTLTSFRQIMGSIKEVIEGVGKSLKVWQQSLRAKMILEIAAAIGILAISLIALSYVPAKRLATGLGAITGLMATMSGTLLALSKINSDVQVAVLASSMVLMAGALVMLAGAIAVLGHLDVQSLAKGVGAMAFILAMMVGSIEALAGLGPVAKGAGTSILLMAFALNIMVAAVAVLGNMDMGTLAKGLGAMAIGLALMVDSLMGLSTFGPGVAAAGAAMVLVAGALTVMAAAVFLFGNMDLGTLAQGMGALAIGLGIMVGALLLLGGNVEGVLGAGAAMVLMATAMNILFTAVLALGAAPWQVVAKGLGFMAAALAILLLAALGAMFVAPGLEALGTAALLLGAALFLAGAGMAAFGTGFALLAATGAAGTAVLIATIHAVLALLPEIALQAAAAFVAFVKVVANASGELRKAFGTIFKNILGVISDNIPAVKNLLIKLIGAAIDVIKHSAAAWVEAGFYIIDKFIGSVRAHVPHIATEAMHAVTAFVTTLGNNLGPMLDAGAKMIVKFVEGLSKAINNNVAPMRKAGLDLAMAIVNGMTGGLLGEGMNLVKSAASKIADAIPGPIKKIMGIASPAKAMVPLGEAIGAGMAQGISRSVVDVVRAVLFMANAVIAAGDKVVAKAQNAARKQQAKAYAAQARADIRADEAADAAKFARQHKKDKAAQRRANQMKKDADRAQKEAGKLQKQADAASQRVTDAQTFQQADLHGKGDIRNDAALGLADKAQKTLAKANAEAARGRELLKTNRKAGEALLAEARKDAKEAAQLSKRARDAHKDAERYYAKEVDARIKAMEDATAADEKAKQDQAELDAADAQGKADILNARAAADEARAKKAHDDALALIAKAKKVADTDAAEAMRLLDKADALTQEAKDAADKAKEERDQAEQALTGGASGSGGTTDSISPSRSVLEDAAQAVDRYTASLLEAQDLAAAQQGVIQFVQNNNSPVALSASEIYRQSKNLLSSAEVKMGAGTTKSP